MADEIQNGQEVKHLDELTQDDLQAEQTAEVLSPSNEQAEELPTEASDRTREQFEKLKKHNEELQRKLEQHETARKLPSVLDAYLPGSAPTGDYQSQQFAPPVQYGVLNQNQVQEVAKQLFDEQGYIDANVLQQRLAQADQAILRAQEAEKRALRAEQRMTHFEQTQQTRELYQEFPELNPESEQFNEDAYDLVKKEILSGLVQTGRQDAILAARNVSKYFRKSPEVQRQQVVQAQAAQITRPGSSTGSDSTDLTELRRRTQKGDSNALAERLAAIGA